MAQQPTTDHLWRMMDRFEAAFPTVWAKTWVVDPHVEEDWHAADKWIRTRLRDAGLNERQIQTHSQNLFVRLRHRSPQYFGAKATSGDVVAGVVIPIISNQTWGERLAKNISPDGRHDWAIPDTAPYDQLARPYAVYTFDHETAHAVYHHLDDADRRPADGIKPGQITHQQDETFADIAGGLGIVGHFGPTMATDTIARIAHLRAIAAVHTGDMEHLTTRGLKRAMNTIGCPSNETSRWQLTGMDGARALAKDVPHYALSKDELTDLASLTRLIKPGDTTSADAALTVTGDIARETKSPVIYELMRDYIEGVQALVPEDRYQPATMMRAKLNARRNPLAATVDTKHPRVETVRAEALKRVDIYRTTKRAANEAGVATDPKAAPKATANGPPKP